MSDELAAQQDCAGTCPMSTSIFVRMVAEAALEDLEDGKTILCVYPKGHGRGGIVYKRSTDGGLSWSERL